MKLNTVNRGIIPLFIFFIFFVSFTYSKPVIINEEIIGGDLIIAHPLYDYYKYNEDITLYYHVYNSSSELQTSDEISCLFHLYNNSQAHIVEEYLTMDENDIDFEILLDKSLFKLSEEYQYLIYCNNSEAGIYSNSFTITKTGKEPIELENLSSVALYTLLTLIGLIFLLMIHLFKEDNISLAYGFISGLIFLLEFILLLSGFKVIPNVSLILDVNYYFMLIYLILSLYCFTISYFFYKDNYKPKEINPYEPRK